MDGHWKFLGGGEGVAKAKIFKGKYEAELEFPERWGFKPNKPTVRGVWIFSGTAHSFGETTDWLKLNVHPDLSTEAVNIYFHSQPNQGV